VQIHQRVFMKDDKNKVRHFYKIFYEIINNFLIGFEARHPKADQLTLEQALKKELMEHVNAEEYAKSVDDFDMKAYQKQT